MAAAAAASAASSPVALPSNALYASLLSDFVSEDGRVDYAAMRADPRLDEYCALLSAFDPSPLEGGARLSFWINVYNAFTLQLICKHNADGKLKSINQLHLFGSLVAGVVTKRTIWHTWKFRIGGVSHTLDEVEHTILGGGGGGEAKVRDPLFHASINCASGSCPPLSRKPFETAVIHEQMDQRMRAFVQQHVHLDVTEAPAGVDPEKGDKKVARLNSIFRWYARDFEIGSTLAPPGSLQQSTERHLSPEDRARYSDADTDAFAWGSLQPLVMQYIWQYADLPLKRAIMKAQQRTPNKKWSLEYEDYDWTLNGK